jgi:hypothetical protein
MIGVDGDSTSVTLKPSAMRPLCLAAITPAVSQPAVPPRSCRRKLAELARPVTAKPVCEVSLAL